MILYKILQVRYDHGVSVFPPEDKELPAPEDAMAEPIRDLINNLKLYGYSEDQAYKIISAWAYHAKHDLHQTARGVRVFCEMCIRELPRPAPLTPPPWYGLALLVAVIAAVALGLYLWVYLDDELAVTTGGHPWAYLMRYQEHLWQGEILNVGYKQIGLYERGGDFGLSMESHDRGVGRYPDKDWIWITPGRLDLRGRRLIFYHVYRIRGFYLRFLGVLTHLGYDLYKLREGGEDRYKPRGPWSRPGGRWGKEDYEGCWQKWWWF